MEKSVLRIRVSLNIRLNNWCEPTTSWWTYSKWYAQANTAPGKVGLNYFSKKGIFSFCQHCKLFSLSLTLSFPVYACTGTVKTDALVVNNRSIDSDVMLALGEKTIETEESLACGWMSNGPLKLESCKQKNKIDFILHFHLRHIMLRQRD